MNSMRSVPPRNAPSAPACVLAMPVYNEEGCIEQVLREWVEELDRTLDGAFRIVVVDDGSRDRTQEILARIAAKEPRLIVISQANGGHGRALLRAYWKAVACHPEFVFQVDSDDQFQAADFRSLWNRRRESPCILGCRVDRHDALHRLVVTRILRLVVAAFYGHWIRDSNVPFRLLRTDFLRSALEVIPPATFAPNILVAVLGARCGANLLHVPVTHADRKTGTVSIVRWRLIRACCRCVGELFAFRRTIALRPLPSPGGRSGDVSWSRSGF